MKVFVISKREFDSLMSEKGITDSNVESGAKTFFISINDTVGTKEKPYFKVDKSNVMNLFFDDIEKDIEHPEYGRIKAFTKTQAIELIKFIENNKDKETCIVHCSAGISRSGAIGTFVNDYFSGDYNEFKKQNPHVLPNGLVLRILNRILREKSYI